MPLLQGFKQAVTKRSKTENSRKKKEKFNQIKQTSRKMIDCRQPLKLQVKKKRDFLKLLYC